jgi:DNA recombination protein RmuC
MNSVLIILLILFLIINIAGVFIFLKSKKSGIASDEKQADSALQMILQQINEQTRTNDLKISELMRNVDQKLGLTTKDLQDSLRAQSNESYKVIQDITEKLTKLDESQKQVVSLGDRIQDLQNILKNPKQRGVLGEYYLETLLKNVMPPGSYAMQFNLGKSADGAGEIIVDAVVFVKDKIIPIDSKFSLENYNRMAEEKDESRRAEFEKAFVNDLKLRIKETSKYIKPEKNTLDFAFMFIPHEAIYYDLLINRIGEKSASGGENLIEKSAREYKVIIVSPTSFLAYLQTVLQGLKSMQIEEQAQEIVKRVGELSKHISAQDKYMESLGKSLGTTVNHYEKAYSELKKIDKDVYRIAEKTAGVEPLKIDKPSIEDIK